MVPMEMGVMDFELAEGKVYGAKYYTVKPVVPEMYHQIQQTWLDMIQWNVETFGPSPKEDVFEPGGRWYANNAKFWFKNKADRDWFLLRWE